MRRISLKTTPHSISLTLDGEVPPEEATIGSLVMHDTLSIIDEHITGMSNAPTTRAANEEENDTYTEEEVKTWSLNHVAEYLKDVGVEKKHCDLFRDQDFTGEALLGVDRNFISPTWAHGSATTDLDDD